MWILYGRAGRLTDKNGFRPARAVCEVSADLSLALRKQMLDLTELSWVMVNSTLQSQLGYFRTWLKLRVLTEFYRDKERWWPRMRAARAFRLTPR